MYKSSAARERRWRADKKRKLALKNIIAKLESKLIPDQPA